MCIRDRKNLDESGDKIDTQLSSLRQTEKEQTSKKELVFIAHSKNEAKLTSLKESEQKLSAKMWEDYELTYSAAVKFAEENDCHVIEDLSLIHIFLLAVKRHGRRHITEHTSLFTR